MQSTMLLDSAITDATSGKQTVSAVPASRWVRPVVRHLVTARAGLISLSLSLCTGGTR